MEFEYHNTGNSEAQEKEALSRLFAQSGVLAATGVLGGLVVTQAPTANGTVLIAVGSAVVHPTMTAGASLLVCDSQKTLDIFTANPVGGLPRNDIVEFDSLTALISVRVGTPNATPTDPTVPNTSVALARLRHIASAVAIDTAHIDTLIVTTTLRGVLVPVDSGWITATLNLGGTAGNWTATSGYPLQYRKIDNRVWVRGMATNAGVNTAVVTTLPVGFRPSNGQWMPVTLGSGSNLLAQPLVAATGIISIPSTSYYTGTGGLVFSFTTSFLTD